jgi:hypothetical protein
MISGKTTLIAHLGFPTEAFKAPMIYNPWFDKQGIDAVVVPMGVKPEDYAASLPQIFRFSNLRGALVTMPHKVTTMSLVDEVTPTARVAGACNAILKRPDGTLLGDQFDGAGFVRGVERKGRLFKGSARAGVGHGRRGLGHCGVDCRGRRRRADAVRHERGLGQRAGRAAARELSANEGLHRLEGPGRLRRGGQCHAAGHEGERPAALRRGPHRSRPPSSARS